MRAYKTRGKCLKVFACCARISAGMERVAYLFFLSLIVVHIVACMWYFIDRLEPSVDSWVIRYHQGDSSNLEVYISACYWAITTLATVGYGDILPANTLDRAYCSLVMLLGVVFYSYTIGTVTGLLGDFDRRQTKLQGKLSALQNLAKKYQLSHHFFRQLKAALEQDQHRVRREREDVLSSLPKKLSARLTLLMHKRLLSNNRFFKQRSLKFVQSVLPLLKQVKVTAEETVYKAYEMCDESNPQIVYFVGRGKLGYYIDELHVHIIYEEIRDKDYFGDVEFFFADQREVNVKGLMVCELLALGREDLFNKLFPEFEDLKIEMIVEAAARRDRLKALREEAELRRRDQYKRARGLPLTLSSNEIERLHEIQPALGTELFEPQAEGGYVEAVSFQGEEQKAEPLFIPVEKRDKDQTEDRLNDRQASNTGQVTNQDSVPKRQASPNRREKRSATTPYAALEPEEVPDQRKAKLSELKNLLNQHTLALLETGPRSSEEVSKAFTRIESSLERIESLLNAFAGNTKSAQRRSSLLGATVPFD